MTITNTLNSDFTFTLSSLLPNKWYMYSKGFNSDKKRVETDYISYEILNNKIQIKYLWIGCKLLDNTYKYKEKSLILNYPISFIEIEKYLSINIDDFCFSKLTLENMIDCYNFERHMYIRNSNKTYHYFFLEENIDDKVFYAARILFELLTFEETSFDVKKKAQDNLSVTEMEKILSPFNITDWII